MNTLTLQDLWKLEDYAEQRAAFKARVLAHKRPRKLHLGEHFTLLFEDRLTVQYQVQEMLRIERIFERRAIQDELDAYNPLIPDGRNWKATLLIEYQQARTRARMLAELRGVERTLWAQVGRLPPIAAVADEDLERENEAKTSAVHFLRWPLGEDAVAALRAGAELRFGIDHPKARIEQAVSAQTRAALLADLAP